ncbi:hypothetical protein [Candidatus Viridilinea mediisalina]|uniref:hypothetical protein n=1 Tax=Candidatus Viridilinea mediisalina TaxID=2024553 RepID=UPI0013FE2F8A|nr:hypothetical protein [Candidatus Viridilinea mediisalina]
MKPNFLLLAMIVAAAIYIITLRRQLEAAMMRGDMYREISSRLDKRISELSSDGE